MVGEQLILAIHLENNQEFNDVLMNEIAQRNSRLLNYKRVHGVVVFSEDFPRTPSLKIKRNDLATRLAQLDRDQAILPL
jgi:acyl-coenzyme A synthetase/AMP-(fatty) acid ligase